jgi:hypothetical protein
MFRQRNSHNEDTTMGQPYTETTTKYLVNGNLHVTSLQAVRAISAAVRKLTEDEYDTFVEAVYENDGNYFKAVEDLNHNLGRTVIGLERSTNTRTFT